jgi:hypothetical protein
MELHTVSNNFNNTGPDGGGDENPLAGAPPFPGKQFVFFSSGGLEDRRVKLESYLSYFIDSKAMGSENVADAIMAFLEVCFVASCG